MAENDVWYYTLTTGTNRPKTWEEIAAPENTLTGDDWVKITVAGETVLKSVLDRLPEDEEVHWVSPEDPRALPALGEYVELPSESVVREINAYSRKRGINLSVGD